MKEKQEFQEELKDIVTKLNDKNSRKYAIDSLISFIPDLDENQIKIVKGCLKKRVADEDVEVRGAARIVLNIFEATALQTPEEDISKDKGVLKYAKCPECGKYDKLIYKVFGARHLDQYVGGAFLYCDRCKKRCLLTSDELRRLLGSPDINVRTKAAKAIIGDWFWTYTELLERRYLPKDVRLIGAETIIKKVEDTDIVHLNEGGGWHYVRLALKIIAKDNSFPENVRQLAKSKLVAAKIKKLSKSKSLENLIKIVKDGDLPENMRLGAKSKIADAVKKRIENCVKNGKSDILIQMVNNKYLPKDIRLTAESKIVEARKREIEELSKDGNFYDLLKIAKDERLPKDIRLFAEGKFVDAARRLIGKEDYADFIKLLKNAGFSEDVGVYNESKIASTTKRQIEYWVKTGCYFDIVEFIKYRRSERVRKFAESRLVDAAKRLIENKRFSYSDLVKLRRDKHLPKSVKLFAESNLINAAEKTLTGNYADTSSSELLRLAKESRLPDHMKKRARSFAYSWKVWERSPFE